jgi:pimeloyl-ACP methyl ester carboxylesterase
MTRSGGALSRLPLLARVTLVTLITIAVTSVAAGCRDEPPRPGGTPSAAEGEPASVLRRVTLSARGAPGGTVAYWSNAGPDEAAQRTRAVIIVHGDQRNAREYLAFTREAARIAGSEALIIAPRFVTTEDDDRAPDDLTWGDGDWKTGALPREDDAVSSFEVIDHLLAELAAAGGPLTDVVVAGHSAGGQFVQRYAAAARLPAGLRVHFVVANPSSYLYLDERRPDGGGFEEPSSRERRSCGRYDRYKYGLERRPAPLDDVDGDTLRTQYLSRDVTILLGALDTSDEDNLDRGCEARMQGAHRYERGVLFYQYVQAGFSPDGAHTLGVIPGVGHDARAMLTSDAGRRALFGSVQTSR